MRIIQTFIFLLLFSCINEPSKQQEFLNELGAEKAEGFNRLMDSYERFLRSNFSDKATLGEQTKEYIKIMIEDRKSLIFDSLDAIQVLSKLEYSGLRKEIFFYKNESYKPIYNVDKFLLQPEHTNIDSFDVDFEDIFPFDSIELSEEQKRMNLEKERQLQEVQKWRTYPNENGLFIYSLAKVMKLDTSFMVYCQLRHEGLMPSLTTKYLELPELELWQNKIPLAIDFYLYELLTRYGEVVKKGS